MLILTREEQYGENGIVVMGDVAVTQTQLLTNWHRLHIPLQRQQRVLQASRIHT